MDKSSESGPVHRDPLTLAVSAAGQHLSKTACKRCHARKVKCSGGQPCRGCQIAGKEPECSYLRRQRFVKIEQQHLETLIREVEKLRTRDETATSAARRQLTQAEALKIPGPPLSLPASGAFVEQTPWYMDLNIPNTPILIGEPSEPGFATRVIQAISNTMHSHIPRSNYPTEEQILTLSDADCPWPTMSKARLLVSAALKAVNQHYYVIQKSHVWAVLDRAMESLDTLDSFLKSKLWAIFAIGELYSTRRMPPGKIYPGLAYFAKATRSLRVICERPRLDGIETRLLLGFYSLAVNRRHSAYALNSSAMRHSLVVGLHLNMPKSQIVDDAVREHRNRVWWTAYVFDRIFATNLGDPVSVPEEVIGASLPTDLPSPPGDFVGSACFIARIRLMSVFSDAVESIYDRNPQAKLQRPPLGQRIEAAYRKLCDWKRTLLPELQMAPGSETESRSMIVSLHLQYHQCVIVCTRPVLLSVLRSHVSSWLGSDSSPAILTPSLTLASVCAKSAEESVDSLQQCWVDGSFATFDHIYAQYLFSDAIVLSMSTLLDRAEISSGSQKGRLETASEVLSELSDSGHLAAVEFHRQIEAIKIASLDLVRRRAIIGGPSPWRQTVEGGMRPEENLGAESTGMIAGQRRFSQTMGSELNLDLHDMDEMFSQDMSQGLYWPSFD